jgi:phosphoglycerol geranylgeranyltransferase
MTSGRVERLIASDERARLAGLVDPDRVSLAAAPRLAERLAAAGFDLILFGTSRSERGRGPDVARALHRATPLPVVLFPGSADHVTAHADALLFLVLLSGRNPDFLVGEQVRAARRVRSLGIPSIPTAYILIDGGRVSTVERVTGSAPLARGDVDAHVDHALAAELLGLRAIYLEAGSGAPSPVPLDSVRAVRAATSVPILVGGGVRTPETCAALVAAGADTVVVGTAIERGADDAHLREMAVAAHEGRARVAAP